MGSMQCSKNNCNGRAKIIYLNIAIFIMHFLSNVNILTLNEDNLVLVLSKTRHVTQIVLFTEESWEN